MIPVILWVITAWLDSLWRSFRKKSLDLWKLSKTMFKYYAFILGSIIVLILSFIFWIDNGILGDYKILIIAFIAMTVKMMNTFLQLTILKNIKLSEVLPYDNLDKLFIVIISFFLYYWSSNQVSNITLWITILTIILITAFSIDFKNLKVPKSVWLILLNRLISACVLLVIWYILLSYSNITFAGLSLFYELVLFTIVALLLKDSFKSLFTQTKTFYVSRVGAWAFGRIAYMIGLYIIETSWLIVATLLWFLWIVFSVFSMKYILNDKPSRKQIMLAFMVIGLIWIWFYFK